MGKFRMFIWVAVLKFRFFPSKRKKWSKYYCFDDYDLKFRDTFQHGQKRYFFQRFKKC